MIENCSFAFVVYLQKWLAHFLFHGNSGELFTREKRRFLPHNWSDKGPMDTVVNRAWPSKKGKSLKKTTTVSLINTHPVLDNGNKPPVRLTVEIQLQSKANYFRVQRDRQCGFIAILCWVKCDSVSSFSKYYSNLSISTTFYNFPFSISYGGRR